MIADPASAIRRLREICQRYAPTDDYYGPDGAVAALDVLERLVRAAEAERGERRQ